jgi:hypothetical protein
MVATYKSGKEVKRLDCHLGVSLTWRRFDKKVIFHSNTFALATQHSIWHHFQQCRFAPQLAIVENWLHIPTNASLASTTRIWRAHATSSTRRQPRAQLDGNKMDETVPDLLSEWPYWVVSPARGEHSWQAHTRTIHSLLGELQVEVVAPDWLTQSKEASVCSQTVNNVWLIDVWPLQSRAKFARRNQHANQCKNHSSSELYTQIERQCKTLACITIIIFFVSVVTLCSISRATLPSATQ